MLNFARFSGTPLHNTHSGNEDLDKMAVVCKQAFKCIFLKYFCDVYSNFKFLFHRIHLTISKYWFRQWLAPYRQQSITRINDDRIHWRTYTSLGIRELSGVWCCSRIHRCNNMALLWSHDSAAVTLSWTSRNISIYNISLSTEKKNGKEIHKNIKILFRPT